MSKMSSKVKRKVTVENSKDSGDHPRRPSVFDRLGPGAPNLFSQSQDRHSRVDSNEKCRDWIRTGNCAYGNSCRYQHDVYAGPARRSKSDKDIKEKDLRHKMRNKREEAKEPRTASASPKRKGSKRSSSRSRKGEHESKIKSTVVVTRPRSPTTEHTDKDSKKKGKSKEENWDDSDEWDATKLDYKEELTLERRRQQLQRELALELQKEKMMNENVTVTKGMNFSESSSSSSSSESGSISTSSDSSSSSSDGDSDDSSSSSSSSSSSESRPAAKKKYKKTSSKKEAAAAKGEIAFHKKPIDDYDKIKSSRAAKYAARNEPARMQSPASRDVAIKKIRKHASPALAESPKHRSVHEPGLKGSAHGGRRGPRTPSPPAPSRKQRNWAQSSSTDSRLADTVRSKGKRHKKKKDSNRHEKHKGEFVPTPPQLSSPNRASLLSSKKKSRQRENTKSHRKGRESPVVFQRVLNTGTSPVTRHVGINRYSDADKFQDRASNKVHGRKSDTMMHLPRHGENNDRTVKRPRLSSPPKDNRRKSLSPRPHHDRYAIEPPSRKMYSPLQSEKNDKVRRRTPSPPLHMKGLKDRRKHINDPDKHKDMRDHSPRPYDRDNQYHSNSETHTFGKKDKDDSRDLKKGRGDKSKDRGMKDRNSEHELWSDDHKKSSVKMQDTRGRSELAHAQTASRHDRSKERDRKKGKERELPIRSIDELERDRQRLSPPLIRGPPPPPPPLDILPHHSLRDELPRARAYDSELPPDDRDFGYGYPPHREPTYLDDRPLPPDYDSDLHVPSLYPPPDASDYPPPPPPPGYADSRYRREPPLKASLPISHIERIDRIGYVPRELSPIDPVVLPLRDEEYLPDLAIDDRRVYDDRWGRGRPLRGDDWDLYPALTPDVIPPPHVGANLDEDRYGMPRRHRRASPDWHMRRPPDDREPPVRDRRSRSPPPHRRMDDQPLSGRPWSDQPDRRGNRNDNRIENTDRNKDDRKANRAPLHRDRRDRNDGKDRVSLDNKPVAPKDKGTNKRPHSPSPVRKDNKRRRQDVTPEATDKDKGPKKLKEDIKGEAKVTKGKLNSGKAESPPPVAKAEPIEAATSTETSEKEKEKENGVQKPVKSEENKQRAKPRKEGRLSKKLTGQNRKAGSSNKAQGDDGFSDWSDGDDDLLNREDANDLTQVSWKTMRALEMGLLQMKNSGKKVRRRDELRKGKRFSNNLQGKDNDKQKRSDSKDFKTRQTEFMSESRSRTTSKERANSENGIQKSDTSIQNSKETDSSDAFVVKDEAAAESDDFITTESVDYDPISDDELEALIEEPDDCLMKTLDESEETKIVDALDVNWSALMNVSRPEIEPGNARKRFKAAHILTRIGFSKAFAGEALTKKIMAVCQKQLDEENEEENQNSNSDPPSEPKKFTIKHPVAAFHSILVSRQKERQNVFNKIGPARRALCARHDLHIRKLLCRPLDKVVSV